MKIIYIIILLIFNTTCINAQTKESTDINSIVDYVTCVCVNDALPEANKVNCNNEKLTLKSIPENEKSTIELFKEFQKLREKTSITNNLKFFSEDIFNTKNQYSKIYAFAEGIKSKRIEVLKIKIKKFINEEPSKKEENIISDQPNALLGKPENTGNEDQYNLPAVDEVVRNNTTPHPVSSFFSVNFWAFCSFGLFILTIILFIIQNKQKSKIKKDYESLIKNFKSKNKSDQSSAINTYLDKISALNNKILDLENKNKDLNAVLNNKTQKNITTNAIPEISNEIELRVPPKPVQEIFYMATPDQNNFDLSSYSNIFKPTQSLYEFTVDTQDKSKASFIFYSDEIGIKDAVNYPHRSILPVCEPQNALNQNAKSIITINPGIAEKRNDKWVVTTKAKIKYE